MTKTQLQARYTQYQNSNYNSVNNFYNNCSGDKRKAESDIHYKMSKNNGYGYKVIGGNSSFFTAGWIKTENNEKYFIFETYQNSYTLEL